MENEKIHKYKLVAVIESNMPLAEFFGQLGAHLANMGNIVEIKCDAEE